MTDHVVMGVLVHMPAAPRGPVPAIVGVLPNVEMRAMIVNAEPAGDCGDGALVEFLAVYKVVDGDGSHVLFL